jgi:hypothetical protein
MKKLIALSAAMYFAQMAQAQFMCTYTLLNQPMYKGINLRPNAILQVYSETDGGELVGTTTVGTNGCVSGAFNAAEFGFLLDRKNAANPSGNNLVQAVYRDLFDCTQIEPLAGQIKVQLKNRAPLKLELLDANGVVLDVITLNKSLAQRNVFLANTLDLPASLRFKRLNGALIAEQAVDAYTPPISYNSGNRQLKVPAFFSAYPVHIIGTNGSVVTINEAQFNLGVYDASALVPGVYIASSADKKQHLKFVVTP